jgi:putative transcriptional regulator
MSRLVGSHIKELRSEQGMSQQQLAEIVNVRRETIVRLEKGNYNPTLSLAIDIARVFGKQIEEIFVFEDSIECLDKE